MTSGDNSWYRWGSVVSSHVKDCDQVLLTFLNESLREINCFIACCPAFCDLKLHILKY